VRDGGKKEERGKTSKGGNSEGLDDLDGGL